MQTIYNHSEQLLEIPFTTSSPELSSLSVTSTIKNILLSKSFILIIIKVSAHLIILIKVYLKAFHLLFIN